MIYAKQMPKIQKKKNLSVKPLGYCFLMLTYSYTCFKVKFFGLGNERFWIETLQFIEEGFS